MDWLSRALPGVHKLGLAFGYFLFSTILVNVSLKYQYFRGLLESMPCTVAGACHPKLDACNLIISPHNPGATHKFDFDAVQRLCQRSSKARELRAACKARTQESSEPWAFAQAEVPLGIFKQYVASAQRIRTLAGETSSTQGGECRGSHGGGEAQAEEEDDGPEHKEAKGEDGPADRPGAGTRPRRTGIIKPR